MPDNAGTSKNGNTDKDKLKNLVIKVSLWIYLLIFIYLNLK